MRKILCILVGIIALFLGGCYLLAAAADGAASALIHGGLVGFAVYLFAKDAWADKIRPTGFDDSDASRYRNGEWHNGD